MNEAWKDLSGVGGNKDTKKSTTLKMNVLLSSDFHVASIHITETSTLVLVALGAVLVSVFLKGLLELHTFSFLPESAEIIIIGMVFGLVMLLIDVPSDTIGISFNPEIFFLILIPPIIHESGYFLDNKNFFNNIGTISLFAVVGTLANTFIFGFLLWGLSPMFSIDISLLECLVFGSLISAVDPVAVLSIFESVQVNETLNMLVFGESVLNDAVSIVLYNTFLALAVAGEIEGSIIGLALAKFLIVAGGGLIVGVFFALLTSFFTKFTQEIHVMESLIIIIFGFCSYIVAEIFKLSGIVAILFCGIVQSRYTQPNLSNKSHTCVKYFMKSLALSAETVIFLQLGIQTIYHFFSHSTIEDTNFPVRWDSYFIILSTFMIIPIRFLLVLILTSIANSQRRQKIMMKEQFIMSYGGLRGAIAYALAFSLPFSVESKGLIVTTTLIIILWTVFVQGGSINFFLSLLEVELASSSGNIATEVFGRSMDDIHDALMIITGGYSGLGGWRHVWSDIDARIYKIFVRELLPEERKLVQIFNKIQRAQAHEILQDDINEMNNLMGNVNPDRLKYAPQQKLKEKDQIEWSSDSDISEHLRKKDGGRMQRTDTERFDINPAFAKGIEEAPETRELRGENNELQKKIDDMKKQIRKYRHVDVKTERRKRPRKKSESVVELEHSEEIKDIRKKKQTMETTLFNEILPSDSSSIEQVPSTDTNETVTEKSISSSDTNETTEKSASSSDTNEKSSTLESST